MIINLFQKKNEDGSYKLKDGAEAKITIPAKDLLINIKPKAPTLALSKDEKSITITPDKVDTDAKIITVSYKDKDGKDQTTTATKDDNGTWSIKGEGSVDTNGLITLPKNKVKGETVVSATVTDKGGVADDDKDPLTSDPGTLTVKETKAEKVEALGGLDPVAIKKWVGDEVDWKDGVKSKDDAKKDEVEELLKDAKFEDVTEAKRSTSKEGDFEGKIKITFNDKSEIVVEKQMLYVSNHVTSTSRKDKVPTDALDVEFKLGEGTKVNNSGSGAAEGNKDNPTSYSKYKVKPNTNLKEYKIPATNVSVVDSIKLSAQDRYVDPTWNTDDFVATTKNNVFTATATKTFKVTVKPNGGTGDDKVETKKSGEKYTLPKGDTFTPPENKEFAGWLVGDATTTTDPDKEITITGDTVIKASWKPIMVDVSFDKGEGSGNKDKVSVAKGSEYTLPDSEGFTPPKNKEFAGWQVRNDNEVKAVGTKITVNENTILKAIWKDKQGDNPGTHDTPGGDNPGTTPGTPGTPGTPETPGTNPAGKLVVIVDPNGGNWNGDKAIKTYYLSKGEVFTLNEAPVREGYVFKYWKGSRYNPGDKYTVEANHTFTAVWEPDPKNPLGSKGPSSSRPNTGDRDLIYLYTSILLMSAGTVYAIGRKRSKEK